MTDVGKVTVGVEVNASNLGAKLAAEIERAVRPAIAAVNRQLTDLNRKIQNLDSGGFDRLTKKAREASAAIHLTGNAARGAGRVIDQSIRESIRHYERLADAAERSANRQIAAAARVQAAQAAMGSSAGGGGGGGGGSGGSRGSFGGDGRRGPIGRAFLGKGGMGSFLASPIGVNSLALGVGNLPAFTTAVVQATGSVQQLVQGVLLLPGAIAAVGTSVGVAILGFRGMGDSVKAMWTAFQSGDPKDMEKANKLLEKMAPNAQSALKALSSFFPQLKELRQLTQQNMFAGIDSGLKSFIGTSLPTATKGLDQVSRAWNKTLTELLRVGGKQDTQGMFAKIFGNTAETQNRLNRTIEPFVHAMGTLAATGSGSLPKLAGVIDRIVNRFDAFITSADKSGNLTKWIDQSIAAFEKAINVVVNLGKVINDLTGAAGGDFLGWLERLTGKWHTFLSSAEGKQKFGDFFKNGAQQLRALGDFLKPLATDILPAIIEACSRWSEVLMPFLQAASHLLGAMPGLVQALTLGFIAMRTLSPFKSILTDLGMLNSGLTTAQRNATGVNTALGGGTSAAGGSAGSRGRFRTVATDLARNAGIMVGANLGISGVTDDGGGAAPWLKAIGGGAITGASIGSFFGPAGAAVGAGVGGLSGATLKAVNDLLNENAKATERARAAEAAHADALAISNAAMDEQRAAIKSMNDALLDTAGVFDSSSLASVGDQIAAIPDKLADAYDKGTLQALTDDLKSLNLSADQMSSIVTGSQSGFDALIARLNDMGPAGAIAAGQLASIRDNALQASENAATAAPLIQQLADALNTTTNQAAADLQNALSGIPHDVPINVNMPGGQEVYTMLQTIGAQINANEDGTIHLAAPLAPAVLDQLRALGWQIQQNRDGTINVHLDEAAYQQTLSRLGALGDAYRNLFAGTPALPNVPAPPPNVNTQAGNPWAIPAAPPRATGGIVSGYADGGVVTPWTPYGDSGPFNAGSPRSVTGTQFMGRESPLAWLVRLGIVKRNIRPGYNRDMPGGPGAVNPNWQIDLSNVVGHSSGGVLPGYSPGVDNMLVPLSGGEGIVIPEAMKALGPNWLYGINSLYRGGLSRQGYADGGVHLGSGALPGPADTELSVLIQIRDLLGGKGGVANNPLAAVAANTDPSTAGSSGYSNQYGTSAGGIGPFGTPIKPRNRGYEMAAAAIQALGGDPEKFLGADPSTYVPPGMSTGGLGGGIGSMDFSSYATALQAFAGSGSVSDVSGIGLDANDPVVRAIASARNKKKGIGSDAISDLIGQVFGGGFTGTLNSDNTSLVGALQTYREKLSKAAGVPAAGAGGPLSGNAAALIQFAQQTGSGSGKYAAASDLAGGLADCSGAVSDLVELITQGKTSPDRLFTTHTAAGVLQSLGAQPGLIPGMLQIGINPQHMAATLPNGVNFESGGSAGGPTYGAGAAGANASQFTDHWSLPVNGAIPMAGMGAGGLGLGGAMGGSGTPVYVTNWPGQGDGGIGAGILGAGLDAAGQAATGIGNKLIDGVASLGPNDTGPGVDLASLMKEGNPLAVARALGFTVPDFSRAGGEGGEAMKNDASYTAQGLLMSDTGSITDRTASSVALQIDDMKKQLVSVMDQVSDKLGEDALKPVMASAIQSGLESLKDSVSASLGAGMGTAAGPIMASDISRAVASAMPSGGGGGGGAASGVNSAVTAATNIVKGMASGGSVTGGTKGVDSVPIMAQHGEYVLNPLDVSRMGGFAGVERFRAGLANGTIPGFATGGGVISNKYAGAEFFGVSQVPVAGTIVNVLVQILLSILGIQLEERDTLQESTDEFRKFRGDFKEYDAQGRLLNDTSALTERTQSSDEEAAQERIRILKLVISELIKFIFNQIVIPITKAVANSAIQAGASAASAAINSQAPGAGSIVGSLISSAGQAGVDIGTEIWGQAVDAITPVATDLVGDLLQSIFPNAMQSLFSGDILSAIFNPIGDILGNGLGGLFGGILSLFGVAGGAATDVGMFDSGGMAEGMGLLPKGTLQPERVLSPRQTSNHERLTDLLDSGALNGLGGTRVVHVGGITVMGGQQSADEIGARLTKLLT